MKRDDLLDSIGGIDREIIEESQKLREDGRARKNRMAVVIPIAAAAVLLIGVISAVWWNSRTGNTAAEGPGTGEVPEPVETVSLYESNEEAVPEVSELMSEAAEAAESARQAAEEAEEQRKAAEEAEKQAESARKAEIEAAAEKAAREAEEAARKAAEEAAKKAQEEASKQNEPARDEIGRLILGVELQYDIPQEIMDNILAHQASIRWEIMCSQFDCEIGLEKDLSDLVLLYPFVVEGSEAGLPDMGVKSWEFPVMSKDRIICTLVLTQYEGNEIMMGKSVVFSEDLNALLGNDKEHRVVMKDRPAVSWEGDPSTQPTGYGVTLPEYDFPETGKTVAYMQELWDLSIEQPEDERAFSVLAAYSPDTVYEPDLDRCNTHVFYFDGNYAVYRVHHDDDERVIILENSGGVWTAVCDIRSELRNMQDRIDELTASCEVLYRYIVSVSGADIPAESEKMMQFLRNGAAVPNPDSLNVSDGALKYTDEEMEALRNHVSFSYDPEMSEKLIPTYIAKYIASDNGFLSLKKPVLCIRMDCPDTDDPKLQNLLRSYFGDTISPEKPQYFILSDKPGYLYLYDYCIIPDPEKINEWLFPDVPAVMSKTPAAEGN